MAAIYVDGPWTSAFDTRGVTITYYSGGEPFVRRMSRKDYRMGLEAELERLNEYEDGLRVAEVVPIKRKRRAH